MKEFELNNFQVGNNEEQGFNFEKLFILFKKVWYWLPILIVVSFVAAYFLLKYTKPVYSASSLIKVEIQKDASDLGISNLNMTQKDNLPGEVELLKSPLVAGDVIKNIDLKVSYFAIGEILNTDIYKSNPFEIVFYSSDSTLVYDKNFYVTFINEYEFTLSEDKDDDSKKYRIGETINYNGFSFALRLINLNTFNIDQKQFYFKINSDGTLINYLLSSLLVDIASVDAKTISITFSDNNRQKAIDIVNAYNTAYLKQSTVKKQKSQEQTLAYIDNQIKETSKKLEEYESGIESFIRSTGSPSPISDYATINTSLIELEKSKLEIEKIASSTDKMLNFIQKDESKDNIFPIIVGIENAQVAEGINKLNELYKQRELLKISNKETTIPFKKIDLEVSLLKSQLLSFVQESKKNINEQKSELSKQIGMLNAEQSSLPSKETELNRLKRFNSLYEKFYVSLIEKQVEFQISKAGTVSEFTILAEAYASPQPISPNKNKTYLMFILFGLLPFVLYMAFQYFFKNVIYSKKALERKLKAPILGMVPSFKGKMPASTIVVDKNPKSAISESLRSIRTNSEFMLPKKPKQIFGVTSTVSGEGKTFFAINYAAIIALTGRKVIILDLDMRKPKIHIGFNVDNSVGMSSILAGNTDFKTAIKNSNVKGLDFITAGPIPPNPNELLLKKEFDDLVDDLFETYDVIMADNPPIGLVSDANVVFRRCDLSIYVVRAGYTKETAIDNINQLYLNNKYANFSVVMNDVNQSNTYGSYGYGYGYGYGYYQDGASPSKKSWLKRLFSKK